MLKVLKVFILVLVGVVVVLSIRLFGPGIYYKFFPSQKIDNILGKTRTKTWNYNEFAITSEVVGISTDGGKLSLAFVWPPTMSRYGSVAEVEIGCNPIISSVLRWNENMKQDEEKGVEILNVVEMGDILVGYCSDQLCTKIINGCQLKKKI